MGVVQRDGPLRRVVDGIAEQRERRGALQPRRTHHVMHVDRIAADLVRSDVCHLVTGERGVVQRLHGGSSHVAELRVANVDVGALTEQSVAVYAGRVLQTAGRRSG